MPSSKLAPPVSLSPASVSPPLEPGGGGNTRLRVRRRSEPGNQFGRLERKPGTLYMHSVGWYISHMYNCIYVHLAYPIGGSLIGTCLKQIAYHRLIHLNILNKKQVCTLWMCNSPAIDIEIFIPGIRNTESDRRESNRGTGLISTFNGVAGLGRLYKLQRTF